MCVSASNPEVIWKTVHGKLGKYFLYSKLESSAKRMALNAFEVFEFSNV